MLQIKIEIPLRFKPEKIQAKLRSKSKMNQTNSFTLVLDVIYWKKGVKQRRNDKNKRALILEHIRRQVPKAQAQLTKAAMNVILFVMTLPKKCFHYQLLAE